jgi:hypothetical protein
LILSERELAAFTASVAVCGVPFSVAVIVAVRLSPVFDVVIVKFAVV